MDQVKIGGFIAELRKEKGLTQKQLAEQVGSVIRQFPSGSAARVCRSSQGFRCFVVHLALI